MSQPANPPHLAYLSLGSNLGDRAANLRRAQARLAEAGSIVNASSLYETEPVEFTRQAWFLNCVVALETDLQAQQLMETILRIEQEMGRLRVEKKGPRLIDIDILLFDDQVIETPGLMIPHPEMTHRRFVLEPLVEIAPNAVHPVEKKRARELLQLLPPGQEVRRQDA